MSDAEQHYRATIRYGPARKQYVMLDVSAATAADALRMVADRLEPGVSAAADIVELRLQTGVDAREFTPG